MTKYSDDLSEAFDHLVEQTARFARRGAPTEVIDNALDHPSVASCVRAAQEDLILGCEQLLEDGAAAVCDCAICQQRRGEIEIPDLDAPIPFEITGKVEVDGEQATESEQGSEREDGTGSNPEDDGLAGV